jgi:hypothetical protein
MGQAGQIPGTQGLVVGQPEFPQGPFTGLEDFPETVIHGGIGDMQSLQPGRGDGLESRGQAAIQEKEPEAGNMPQYR